MRRFIAAAVMGAMTLVLRPATPDARACGGFFSGPALDPERRPSLSREKALIVYDGATQHFIREVAFRRATEPFGFVVPTPARPEVAAVEESPFTALRDRFAFDEGVGLIGGGGGGRGSGSGGGVEVLEQKKVGSFTAFVLAADDEQALSTWLADNGLQSTAEADAWLAHYVRMGFFYVAMRYDPPRRRRAAAQSGPTVAETMRISFATPLPFYPYLEPERSADQPLPRRRLLELWYVGPELVNPIALRQVSTERSWVRPLQPGGKHRDARARVRAALPDALASLLPEGEVVVQVFRDYKTDRSGYGDILFGSYFRTPRSPERRAELTRLLPILDPELEPSP